MKIYSIFDKPEFLDEVCHLTTLEWSTYNSDQEFLKKVENKKKKILDNQNNKSYAKLILLEENNLVGFISIFPTDGEERCDLTPWYATMYVKSEYRGMGYSKILDKAIKEEAKKRGFKRLYLKSNLNNYYEKFGAKYIEDLTSEKLYYMDI